jgi:hypothetical protein
LALETLTAAGCTFEENTDITDEGYLFGRVYGVTELDEDELADWLSDTINPRGGDVVEWFIVELRDERLRRARS